MAERHERLAQTVGLADQLLEALLDLFTQSIGCAAHIP